MSFGSFKIVTNKLFVYKSYIYTQDMALNNLQGLICHKTQPTNLVFWNKIKNVYVEPSTLN